MIPVIFLNMIGASGFTFGKALLSYLTPFFLVGLRMSIAGILLLSYYRFINKGSFAIKARHWKLFVGIILIHIYGSYVLEFWAMQCVSSVKTSFLYNLNPFVTALIAYTFFSERLSLKKAAGLIIGFIGCLPMLFSQESCEISPGAICFLSVPELAILGSVVCFAYGWIILQHLVKQGYSPLFANGIGMVGGGILSLITSYWGDNSPHIIIDSAGVAHTALVIIVSLSWLIFVSSMLYYTLYGILLKRYTATFLAFAGFLSPLFAALYGWLFLHEQVGLPFIVSTIITVCGLYLFYQEELVTSDVK